MIKLADAMATCIVGKTNNSAEDSGRSRRKGQDMLPDNVKELIQQGITRGYIDMEGDDHKYGISKENIIETIVSACEGEEDENERVNAEMVQSYIDKLEEDNVKYKYQTDDEWKKAGYSDPLNALRINKKSKNKVEKQKEKPIKTRRYDNR